MAESLHAEVGGNPLHILLQSGDVFEYLIVKSLEDIVITPFLCCDDTVSIVYVPRSE